MSTAIERTNKQAVTQFGEMSVDAIVSRKRKLVEVMQAVMIDGVHYGKIPGCGDKPTLHKAGAEVLATVFGLAPTFVVAEVNLPGSHREYRVTCTLTHIGSGANLGEGVGSCSTMESKYRWRNAMSERKCPECGKPGIQRSKQKPEWYCWVKKDGCGATFPINDERITSQSVAEGKVENPDVADQYNTVLKMAKKRAQVDATLTAVGASDILTQDLEDLAPPRNDVQDADFTDVPTAPRRDPIEDIKNAKTPDELRALSLALSKMPQGELRAKASAAFQARRVELERGAA